MVTFPEAGEYLKGVMNALGPVMAAMLNISPETVETIVISYSAL